MSEESGAQVQDPKPTIQDHLRERAEDMLLSGRLPSWLTMLAYDRARISFGADQETFLEIVAPPRGARREIEAVEAQRDTLVARATKGEDISKDLRTLAEKAEAAEAVYLTAVIVAVGPGIVFRGNVVHNGDVAYKVDEPIPVPREIKDANLRARVISDAIPAFVISRVHEAIGLLTTNYATQGLLDGGRSGND